MKSVVRDRDRERFDYDGSFSVRIFFEIQKHLQTQPNELIDRQRERIKPGKKVVIKYI